MKKVILLILLVALAWRGYEKSRPSEQGTAAIAAPETPTLLAADPKPVSEDRFKCDGRTHCSQMTSCDEANYFLKNCPGVKMDGNDDGVPCERQWCKADRM